MSRSAKFPLLRTLLNAANDARLTDEQLEHRISRRAFLKSSAIIGGISAIDLVLPPITYSQQKGKPRVAIIGAGLAGLTAAYELRKKGIVATIYEANSRVGGRVMTVRDVFGSELYTEYGGEFIDTGHATMFRLANELGLSMIDVKPENSITHDELMYFGGRLRSREELIAGFRPIVQKISEDAAKMQGEYTDVFSKLDHTSLAQYIASLETEQWIKDLLTSAFVIEFGLDAGDQSACNMLSMIDPVTSKSKFALYGESDERYRIRGGNDLVAKGLEDKLASQIRFGHTMMKIASKGSGYSMTFAVGAGVRDAAADIVIMTIPFSVLRSRTMNVKLSGDKRYVIDNLAYGSNSKIIHGIRKQAGITPWMKLSSSGAMFTDLQVQAGWDSAPQQSDFDSTYTIYQGGSNANLGKDSIENSLNDLEKIMPGFNQQYSGKSKLFVWKDYQYSKGSYSAYGVGQWSMQGIEAKPEGNLYFAGEHCSEDYQGFMEGAAETGVKAANAILQKVKR